jgi:hypothetical protein
MNKTAVIASIISGIVGLAVGGGSVVLYYKKIQENYDAELDESHRMISELQEKVNLKADDIKKDLMDKMASKNEYQEAVKSIESAELVTDEETEIDISDETDYPDADESGEIRFIGAKDYEDDEDYEKEKIKFYSKDGVLTQDNDILSLEEFENVCGKKALTSFGKYGSGPNVCYVRNEEYMTDYEIKKYNISYQSYKNSIK